VLKRGGGGERRGEGVEREGGREWRGRECAKTRIILVIYNITSIFKLIITIMYLHVILMLLANKYVTASSDKQ